jgi:hypothetical protein
MGFAASQARYLMLTARKSDLEIQGQFISQARIQLANMSASLYNQSASSNPTTPAAANEERVRQARLAAIAQIDKTMDIMGQRIEKQREAIQTEIEAVRKVIATNIQSTFKTFA